MLTIDNTNIGSGHKPYIIAEMSANHNGNLERAFKILEQAKLNGADAVKIQSYRADTITIDSHRPEFCVQGGLWDGKTLFELYDWAHMPWDWHKPIFDFAKSLDLTLFSSPFDFSAVDMLEELDCPAYKIASFEIVDLPLIRYAAQTGKPMIISTGMASDLEIAQAVNAARQSGCKALAVLHCVSGYPSPAREYNLNRVAQLKKDFPGIVIGLSDHTINNAAAVASVALGAQLIEKHFTLDRNGGGPDDSFSIEPNELKRLVDDTETAWHALGQTTNLRQPSEQPNMKFRRSLYVTHSMKPGDLFTPENLRSIRPASGLAPKYYESILGTRATKAIDAGTPMSWDLSDGNVP